MNLLVVDIVSLKLFGKIFHTNKLIFTNNNNEVRYMSNTNKLVVPGAKQTIENLKYEVARELGIQLGADTTSRLNGTVGGEMTKRLVNLGKQYYANVNNKIK